MFVMSPTHRSESQQSVDTKIKEWLLPELTLKSDQLLFEGIALHPGATTGYFFVDANNIALVKNAVGPQGRFDFIYGTDHGDCEDLHVLAQANGLLSSNLSPNAWCAVQAKSEGIPAVIGGKGLFSSQENPLVRRNISVATENGESTSVEIAAHTVRIANEDGALIDITEGDQLTIDGTTGQVFQGLAHIRVSAVEEIRSLLIDVMSVAIREFGPAQGWSRYRETSAYREAKEQLAALVHSPSFREFQAQLRHARAQTRVKIMATAHTVEGTLQARLLLSDIDVDCYGDVIVTPRNEATGLGLLRTERFFRFSDELDALRALILGRPVVDSEHYRNAEALVLAHESRWLHDLLCANSGCQTVVRTLCMPLNKLSAVTTSLRRP